MVMPVFEPFQRLQIIAFCLSVVECASSPRTKTHNPRVHRPSAAPAAAARAGTARPNVLSSASAPRERANVDFPDAWGRRFRFSGFIHFLAFSLLPVDVQGPRLHTFRNDVKGISLSPMLYIDSSFEADDERYSCSTLFSVSTDEIDEIEIEIEPFAGEHSRGSPTQKNKNQKNTHLGALARDVRSAQQEQAAEIHVIGYRTLRRRQPPRHHAARPQHHRAAAAAGRRLFQLFRQGPAAAQGLARVEVRECAHRRYGLRHCARDARKQHTRVRRARCVAGHLRLRRTRVMALVRMARAHTRGNPAKRRSGNRDYGGALRPRH